MQNRAIDPDLKARLLPLLNRGEIQRGDDLGWQEDPLSGEAWFNIALRTIYLEDQADRRDEPNFVFSEDQDQ